MPIRISFALLFNLIFLFSSYSLFLIHPAHSQSSSLSRAALLAQLLASPYDPSLRPYLNSSQAVAVELSYRLSLLYAVDSKEETYQIDFFIVERWVDPRLRFDYSLWNSNDQLRLPEAAVWKPDTFFFNAVKCSTSDSVLKLVYTGAIIWTRHQVCTFHTQFELLQFPFDSQSLPIERMSFAYTKSELQLLFSSNGCFQPDPTSGWVNSLWLVPDVAICENLLYSENNNRPNSDFSFSRATINVVRLWQNYILKYAVPMFSIVLLSCASYFVDPNSPPARVGFSVALILSIVTFNSVVSADLPKVNDPTLIDWYVWKCFLFVIAALGEFAVVNHLIVSKTYPIEVAKLVDDYAGWTIPGVWILSNLIFWPFFSSPAVKSFFALLMAAYIGGNAYRVVWCFKHKQKGMIEPVRALYRHLKWIASGRLIQPEAETQVNGAEEKKDEKLSVLPESALKLRTINAHGAVNPFQSDQVAQSQSHVRIVRDKESQTPAEDLQEFLVEDRLIESIEVDEAKLAGQQSTRQSQTQNDNDKNNEEENDENPFETPLSVDSEEFPFPTATAGGIEKSDENENLL